MTELKANLSKSAHPSDKPLDRDKIYLLAKGPFIYWSDVRKEWMVSASR